MSLIRTVGEGGSASFVFFCPQRAQTQNVDEELEGTFRAVHPQHDVVDVHGSSILNQGENVVAVELAPPAQKLQLDNEGEA